MFVFFVVAVSFIFLRDVPKKVKALYLFILIFMGFIFLTNLTNYNFTIRTFLLLIPFLLIGIGFCLEYYSKVFKPFFAYLISCVLLVSFTLETFDYFPHQYGDKYHPYKVIYEKLPIVLDWETPSQYIAEIYNDGDIMISHALNPYFLYYYTDILPDISARYIGTSRLINNTYYDQNFMIPVIYEVDALKEYIKSGLKQNHTIYILSSGTNWPMQNAFFKRYFGREQIFESDPSFYRFLEQNSNKLAYIGRDNVTRVYVFKP